MPPFQPCPKQHLPEAHGIAAAHGSRVTRLQFTENVGGGQVEALFMGKRGTKSGGQLFHVEVKRMVRGNVGGKDVAAQVFVPARDAFVMCFEV